MTFGRGVLVFDSSIILGRVELSDGVSIWPLAVLRGDAGIIKVGRNSNVQDGAVLHCGEEEPTIIGEDVTIGHGAVINGAIVGDRCIIGIHATILDGAEIGEECIIGANALVTARVKIPPRSVVLGVPGKIVKENDTSIREKALRSSLGYQHLRDAHLAGRYPRLTE
jgi:carbonic anhydrase/acetyltransferase-like protein (isoleucine patch superfamily)